jgi:hypothetical protein
MGPSGTAVLQRLSLTPSSLISSKVKKIYCTIISVYPVHVQACRGTMVDPGVSVDETDGYVMSYTIPTQADFLIAFSTQDGK